MKFEACFTVFDTLLGQNLGTPPINYRSKRLAFVETTMNEKGQYLNFVVLKQQNERSFYFYAYNSVKIGIIFLLVSKL